VAIGKVGVYYGTRLGATVPWVEGFPFNVVRHPQYVGAVLSLWYVNDCMLICNCLTCNR
jgi:protein-S-isoprenylcysteine O-methyltransferase Ste14